MQKNININCVSPGFIKTEMTEKFLKKLKMLISKIPSGDLGTGDDVSNCVAFLASDSNYINGETIHVNMNVYGLTILTNNLLRNYQKTIKVINVKRSKEKLKK